MTVESNALEDLVEELAECMVMRLERYDGFAVGGHSKLLRLLVL